MYNLTYIYIYMYIMCMCMVDPSHLLYLWFITCTDMWIYKDIYWLVVFNHLELNLENMKVNGWRIIPYIYIYIMENEKCLKPATSIYIYICLWINTYKYNF